MNYIFALLKVQQPSGRVSGKQKITDMKKRILSVLERLVKYALSNKFQLKAILILFSLFGLVFICTSFYNPALLFLALPCIITVIACVNELNKK